MRLYFFPALVPVASIAPAVLAAVAWVAAGFLRLNRTSRARKRFTLFLGAVALTATAIAIHRAASRGKVLSVESLPARDTRGAWTQLLPREPLSDLAWSSDESLLLFGTRQGSLDAVSLRDARLRFRVGLDFPSIARPLVLGDRVIVGEGLHDAVRTRLRALRVSDGALLWEVPLAGHLEAPPVWSDTLGAYFGCAGDAGVYRIDLQGRLAWTRAIGHCDTTPAMEPEGLVVLAANGPRQSRLLLLDPTSPANPPRREWGLSGQPWGTPQRDPLTNRIRVTTGIGDLSPRVTAEERGWSHAIDLRSGRVAWSRPLPGLALLTSLSWTEGQRSWEVHALKRGRLIATASDDGNTLWETALEAPILAPIQRIPGTQRLVALSVDGTLVVVDAVTGATLARHRALPESTSAPIFTATHLIVAARSGLWSIPIQDLMPQRNP